MIVETVLLTPEDAQKLIAVSEGQIQRALKRTVVERLVHAIQTGQWRETHQGIALDSDGRVIDGQHRLHAISRAGVPVRIVIARDVPSAAFDVIDTGTPRSPGDILRIAGYDAPTNLAASIRLLLIYDAVVGSTDAFSSHRGEFTSRDLLRVAASERGKLVARSLTPGRAIAHNVGHNGFGSWLSVLIVLLAEAENVSPDTTVDFLAALRDGTNLSPGSPVLALRRTLSSDVGLIRNRPGDRAQLGLATAIKAFNRWVVGDTSQLVTFKLGIERMPAIAGPA
jgi:hypothetical protein